MRDWLNKASVELNHGNMPAKRMYGYWSFWQKMALLIFVQNFSGHQNWQVDYLRTLLTWYQGNRTIEKIELNCDFRSYDKEDVDLVNFYFIGTRAFQVGPDGQFMDMEDFSTEDGLTNWVPEIRHTIVDGWDEGDRRGVQHICLHTPQKKETEVRESLDQEKPHEYVYSKEEGSFIADDQETGYPKYVFATAARHPCLLHESFTHSHETHPRRSSKFSIIKPERDCRYQHEWFARLGMPSYFKQVAGF